MTLGSAGLTAGATLHLRMGLRCFEGGSGKGRPVGKITEIKLALL
jgi:hypothetical protein